MDGRDLDEWLAGRGAAPLDGRLPVLAYGSNACPQKITWLRANLALTGPVVVLRAWCVNVAAVWAVGWRKRDGERPATLAPAPGIRERHAVWMATPDQLDVLDICEGSGHRYERIGLATGTVVLDGGLTVAVSAYSGLRTDAADSRAPLNVNGAPMRCATVDQITARRLSGTAGPALLSITLPPNSLPRHHDRAAPHKAPP